MALLTHPLAEVIFSFPEKLMVIHSYGTAINFEFLKCTFLNFF